MDSPHSEQNYYRNIYQGYYDKIIGPNDWKPFYNHGYATLDDSPLLDYDEEDMLWKHQCNLYTHLLLLIDSVKDKNLLDVGCGLGHGPNIYRKYFDLGKVDAIDLNRSHISFAKRNFKNVSYQTASATELPYEDSTFDIVTNVESLHCYKFTAHFYRESYRVLKKGGYLLLTDPFIPYKADLIAEDFFARSGYWMVEKRNISDYVARSCEIDCKTLISRFPSVTREHVRFFVDIAKEKKQIYQSKENVFLTYVLQKL